jgi:putative DNA primase/helicase
MTDADLAALTARRKRLLAGGYRPIPANGKAVHLAGWPSLRPTEADIEAWARDRPSDTNTGLLTRDTPAPDIDVLDPDVAVELHREFLSMIGNGGRVIWRVGQAPKHAFLCRTDAPFKKIATPTFISPDGRKHKVEVLCDGQQIIVDGTHPIGKPYEWYEGTRDAVLLDELPRCDELPYLDAAKAEAFIRKVTKLMIAHGWTQEQPQAETPRPAQPASVPFMITIAQKAMLRQLGHSDDDIRNMTPQQAHELLAAAGMLDHDAVAKSAFDAARPAAAAPSSPGGGREQKQGAGAGGSREQKFAAAALDGCAAELAAAAEGERNDRLNKVAYRMGRMVARDWMHRDAVCERLMAAAQGCGLGKEEAGATLRSGLEAGMANPHPDLAAPEIRVVPGEIARVVDEAEAALIAAGVPVMVRAGARFLCRPVVDKRPAADNGQTEVTLLERMNPQSMSYLLNKQAATFVRWDGRSKQWKRINPARAVVEMLLAKGNWRLPHVAGVVSTPTLRPDGTVLSEPGYDPATRLWHAGGLHLPPIIATREAAEAKLRLLKDLLSGFPFVNDLDRSVALSALMTPVLRGGCDVTPLHLIRASTPGSGKSYLGDIASTIVRAQRCPVVTAAHEEEMEKRLGALGLEGVPIVSLDNCTHDLGGAMLCQITERPIVRTRILGRSEMPELDWRGTLFANGNNIGVRGDMTRRTIQCNLDPQMERPELRTFAFNPVERVMADRGAYVAAILTIAQAYLASGERVKCEPIASYGGWSRFVREPLVWLGEADPVRSMAQARDLDPERAAACELIAHWKTCLRVGKQYTAREIVARAIEPPILSAHPEFHQLLLLQCGHGNEVDKKKLGQWLRRIQGQIYDAHKIVLGSPDRHDKVQRWVLIPQDAGNTANAGIAILEGQKVSGDNFRRSAETLPATHVLPAGSDAELSEAEKERLRALWDSRWDS